MMKNREKDFLSQLSKRVVLNLRERNIATPFKFSKYQRAHKTYTDGWSIEIGTLYGYACSAEIWLDKFTGHSDRKIWYCLYSSNGDKKIAPLVKSVQKKFGTPFKINLNNILKGADSFILEKRLNKQQFGQPIIESYAEYKEYFYGIYELDQTGLKRDEIQRLALRVTDFFCDIVEGVKEITQKQNDDYSAIENRKLVTTHILRERRSHVATLRKQKDDYECHICKFNFSEKYGHIGKNYAEAHHIIPLNKTNKVRVTKIEDLITVCANCHRMLHQMKGNKSDIPQLKEIVRKYKNKH